MDRTSDASSLNVGDGLKTLKGKMLLKEFVFTPKAGIRQHFGNPEIAEADFTLIWSDFAPSSARFPQGATHFELQYLILAYDPNKRIFMIYKISAIKRNKKEKSEKLELKSDKKINRKEGMQYIAIVRTSFFGDTWG